MKLLLPLFLLLSFSAKSQVDIGVFANTGPFGVVLDTFSAPVGLGYGLGTQISFEDFIANAGVRRGTVGTRSQKSTYTVLSAGLGGTYEVFYFGLSLDYMMLSKQAEIKTNGGGIGVGLRFGVDVPITEQIGFFGTVNLGTNRMHTHMYIAGGVSYHFPFDLTSRPSSFYNQN